MTPAAAIQSHNSKMWTWTENTTSMLNSTEGTVNLHCLQIRFGV